MRKSGLHTPVVTSGSQGQGVKQNLSPSRHGFLHVFTQSLLTIGHFSVLPAAPQITSRQENSVDLVLFFFKQGFLCIVLAICIFSFSLFFPLLIALSGFEFDIKAIQLKMP